MVRQLLEHSSLLVFPLFALVLFLATFLAQVLRTYGRRAESYADTAALPLADENPLPHGRGSLGPLNPLPHGRGSSLEPRASASGFAEGRSS